MLKEFLFIMFELCVQSMKMYQNTFYASRFIVEEGDL